MFQHCRDVGFNKSFFCRDPTDTLDYILTMFGTDLMFFQPPTQRNHRRQCFLNKITAWMSHICPNLAKRNYSVPVRIDNPKPTWTSSTHSSCMRTKKWWKEKIGMNFSTNIIPVEKINITLANAIVKGQFGFFEVGSYEALIHSQCITWQMTVRMPLVNLQTV